MEIKNTWKAHPLAKQDLIELVPTDWLYKIRGVDVSPIGDLMDGTPVGLDDLWNNISEEGLHDPLIVRVGRINRKYRLESGNHRIQVFKKRGVILSPAVVQIQDECGPHLDNVMTDASHNFDLSPSIDTTRLTNGYAKPSTIFTDLHSDS